MDNRTKLEIAGVTIGILGIVFDVNGMIFPDEPVIVEKEVPIYIDKEIVREINTVKEVEVPVEVTQIAKKELYVWSGGSGYPIIWWDKDKVFVSTTTLERDCKKLYYPGIPQSGALEDNYYECQEFEGTYENSGYSIYREIYQEY